MQMSSEIDDIDSSLSFSCYSSYSLTAKAAAKVSREFEQEQADLFQELSDVEEEDFEFSVEFGGEEFSAKDLALEGRLLFPIFNSDILTKDEVDRAVKDGNGDDSSVIIPLEDLFLEDSDDSPSYSSSEAEESEDRPFGTFCVSWRKADVRSPTLVHCRKSRSTGSDEPCSRKWRIKDLLRRSNSTGKDTAFFLCPKKIDAAKQRRGINSGEVPKVARRSKAASPSFHELFYVQKKAELKGDKMKSYLPYRQDVLGLFVKVNGSGNKKLPF